jgi:hypothetical protein
MNKNTCQLLKVLYFNIGFNRDLQRIVESNNFLLFIKLERRKWLMKLPIFGKFIKEPLKRKIKKN